MTRYYVDWSDQSLPTIRIHKEGDTAYPVTFVDAKREIREHFQDRARFAREQLSELSKLRASDIEE